PVAAALSGTRNASQRRCARTSLGGAGVGRARESTTRSPSVDGKSDPGVERLASGAVDGVAADGTNLLAAKRRRLLGDNPPAHVGGERRPNVHHPDRPRFPGRRVDLAPRSVPAGAPPRSPPL